jgi:hypothetical protein
MYTTDRKPSHSLFPPGTSANQLAAYIREAIEVYPATNPTLSCGTVNVGWDKKRGGGWIPEQRRLPRMRLGDALERRPDRIWSIFNFALG